MDNEINLRAFCKNVYALRKNNCLTQQQMAKMLRISIKTLRSIEKGIVPPRTKVNVLYQLYKAFHILPSDLFKI